VAVVNVNIIIGHANTPWKVAYKWLQNKALDPGGNSGDNNS
jgi:hypothetical protein